MRRIAGLVGSVAVLVVAWVSFAVPVSALAVQPVVTVSATEPMAIHFNCMAEPTTEPGSVTFSRAGVTEGTLTITYHISGGPTDLNSDPAAGADHQAQFLDGEATVKVFVHPAVTENTTDAQVVIVDGAGYAVGELNSGTIQLQTDQDECPTTTTTTTTIAATQDTLSSSC